MELKIVGNESLFLSHKGYTCIARKYNDGRWGFGKHSEITETSNCEYDFFIFASNEEEAKSLFACNIERKLARDKKRIIEAEWKKNNDFKSIAAVFNILPKIFQQRVSSADYDMSLNEKVIGGDYEVPLYYVTKLWDMMLKNSMGDLSYKFGPEEDDDFSVETWRREMSCEQSARTRWEAIVENDMMKTIWKDVFDIDIDNLSIDFSIFNRHMVPNVHKEEENDYFWTPLSDNGLNDWIWCSINHPNKDYIFHNAVSGLMEQMNYLLTYYLSEKDLLPPDIEKWKKVTLEMREQNEKR